jgi:glycosyltransferase involved in cell wall biosynthesis
VTSPTVSIVTPSLNRADLLLRAITSVAQQTYPAIEHIIIDGGSTDGSIELLRKLERRYGIRWISGPDDGMYDAINKGMAMATGDICAYLNSDDLYFPWTVEVAVMAFGDRPDADVVYGDIAQVDVDSRRGKLRLYAPYNRGYLTRSAFIGQPTAFWRRHVFSELGGFDARLRYVADCDFWMRAGRTHSFLKLDEVQAVDGRHGGTLRATQGRDVEAELRRVRNANGAESGVRGFLLRITDIAYHMVHTQLAFTRFAVEWLRTRVLGRPPRAWRRFLLSDVGISPGRLLLALIPDPRRRIGWGVVTLHEGRTTDG